MSKLSDILMRLRKKYREATLSPNTVDLTKYNLHMVRNALERSPELAASLRDSEDEMAGFHELFEDLVGALYRANPRVLQEEEVQPEFQTNRDYIKEVLGSENYQNLRESTTLNRPMSITTAEELAREILEREDRDKTEAENKAKEHKAELLKMLDRAEESEGSLSEAEEERLAAEIEAAEEDLETALAMAKGVDSGLTPQEIQGLVEEAASDAAMVVTALRGFGYSDEEIDRVSADNMRRIRHVLLNRGKLKELADLIGRFRRIARRLLGKQELPDHSTISGITLGDELVDAIPEELIEAAHRSLRPLFLSRWRDEELAVFEREDKNPTGKGPIVAAVDVSGSMEGAKDAWAKALVMAFMEIARRERRDMHIIYFNSKIVGEYHIRRGRVDPMLMTEILNFPTSGGTGYMEPLTRGKEIIARSEMSRADILFVTDGQAHVDESFKESFAKDRARLDFRVVSVLINLAGDPWQLSGDRLREALNLLGSLSNHVVDIEDLTDENAEEIIGSITGP